MGQATHQEIETFDSIRSKVSRGERISRAEGRYLWDNASLKTLQELACIRRNAQNPPNIVTFLVDRNINYTNVCNTDCSFCAFYRHDPANQESYILSRKILKQKVDELVELGGTRVLLQGGHNDDLPYKFYIDLIRWLYDTYKLELNAFSPSEIHQMHLVSGKSYEAILRELKSAGMKGIPGGGAEVLDDEIRKRVSPKKISADKWIEIMEIAHSLDLVTSSNMVIGFGESIEHRLNHLDRLRDLQARSLSAGRIGFNLYVSWVLVLNENTSMGRSRKAKSFGATEEEYLRHTAFCRVYLDNIQHHQASWPTWGPEVAQRGLHLGCDDIGSTMMEENVVSQAGAPTKSKWFMSPEELRSYIRGAGFIPAQRNSAFEILKVYDE